MPKLEWKEEMCITPEIDEQHKKWIAIQNRLHQVLLTGSYKEIEKTALESIKAMQEYTKFHFKFEEEYMDGIQYPKRIEHRRIHKEFDKKIYAYYRDILKGDIVLNSEIIKIIDRWLIDHIMEEDKKIKAFLES